MKHEKLVQYRIKDPYNTGPGFYWAAWNDRNGHAEGGPYKTEEEATKVAEQWERDEFE